MLIRKSALINLIEAAVQPREASKQGLGIVVNKIGDVTNVVAFDPNTIIDSALTGVKESKDDPTDAVMKNGTSGIVGIVSMHDVDESQEGPCYGGYVINSTAARKGYGPMVYDIALSLGKPVMPDRRSVSSFASKVWDVYQQRGDVVKLKLDDKDNPKTPDKRDDCKVFKNPAKSQSLNYAYQKKKGFVSSVLQALGASEHSGMIKNSDNAFKEYNAKLKSLGLSTVSKDNWENQIALAGLYYSRYRYAKDVAS